MADPVREAMRVLMDEACRSVGLVVGEPVPVVRLVELRAAVLVVGAARSSPRLADRLEWALRVVEPS